ncbi:hydroxyacylglutathione hydrolase [Acinetobacter sp. MD2(2019)]|uniref:hydroxyacylglutathione hydrolase n=1 Tax=Acinetobacter sp. MD2(2019) TaxID=2605273 RepID=UPI002D1F2B11|nr:hydroxyacylglutathione hydrolase [Acinetobacter sp. MD2(2019)]MEB3754383.1 hydroxyacylglutathione hydrolase [Acinetobacter sp. MD2(2019)]
MSDYKIHVIDVKNNLKNYIWLVEHLASQDVAVIDPTEAHLVLDYCRQNQLNLAQIWLTHWHKDHIGAVPTLLNEQPNLPIYGPREELSKIPFLSHPLHNEQTFKFHELELDVIAVPGHTLGHIIYYSEQIHSAFVGDSIFAMGCGRVFEGTFEQMFHSLNRIAALPEKTELYCAHEYTLANAQFAIGIEPHNLALQERLDHVESLRMLNQITLPTTVAVELATNPFLRANSLEEFTRIRQLKDLA